MPRALMRQGVGQEPPMRERMQLDLELSPAINSLSELAKAEYECTRCPLYKHATQAVPGAGRSLLGRSVTISKLRGQTLHLADGTAAFVTIHPSWLLRIEDDADKEREYRNLVADLRPAAKVLAKKVA